MSLSYSSVLAEKEPERVNDGSMEEQFDDQKCQNWSRNSLSYHLRTLWLFTRSDLKSTIYPNLVFGLASAMSEPALTNDQSLNPLTSLLNIPYMIMWLWLGLLLFNIANQRLPFSILEDGINKPWRPLPSRRLSQNQARTLLLIVIPIACASSLYLGTTAHMLVIITLTWMYNDLGGTDHNFLIRNIINALGMASYGSGATIIACGRQCKFSSFGYQWVILIGLVVATTLQVQDMSDQAGDAMRGRKTLPLAHGDDFARLTIGISVMVWSIFVPAFWKPSLITYLPSLVIGGTLSFRTILLRDVKADKGTWKIWCIWMTSFYLLPLWSRVR